MIRSTKIVNGVYTLDTSELKYVGIDDESFLLGPPINKLGMIEDLEEELGISVNTLFDIVSGKLYIQIDETKIRGWKQVKDFIEFLKKENK